MYLFAFNIASAIGWAVVLALTLAGIANSSPARVVCANAFSTQLAALLRFVPPTYLYSWSVLAPVQCLAILEVVHVLLRLVRSPLPTTFAQVSSRIVLIYIVARFPSTHTNPVYTTMVLAWSIGEVPRYTYYALGLLGVQPPSWLTWLRYSTFYILYPIGAGSEALLTLSTISEWKNARYTSWSLEDHLKVAIVFIWIPGTCPRFPPLLLPDLLPRPLCHVYPHDPHPPQGAWSPKGSETRRKAKRQVKGKLNNFVCCMSCTSFLQYTLLPHSSESKCIV